jgi:transposase
VDVGVAQSRFVRRTSDERIRDEHTRTHRAFVQRVLFWGCFSAAGPGPLINIHGTMKSGNYIQTVQDHMLPHIQAQYPDGSGIFQQDNAPCHKSRATMAFFQSNNINILDWPPYSPDLNPIENLWGIIKNKVRRFPLLDRQSVVAEMLKQWQDVSTVTICEKLATSMPARIAECITNHGGHTHY